MKLLVLLRTTWKRQVPDNKHVKIFESCLNEMLDINRAAGELEIKAPLAVLGLVRLYRKLGIEHIDEQLRSSDYVFRIAEAIEQRLDLSGRPFSQYLLANFSRVDPRAIEKWLKIAQYVEEDDEFTDWFLTKVDGLELLGHHETPRAVTELIVSSLPRKNLHSVLDPACGTGGLLVEAVKKLNADLVDVSGGESNAEAWSWAKLRFALEGYSEAPIELSNNLHADSEEHASLSKQFDVVVTNPPFGMQVDTAGIPWSRQANLTIPSKLPARISSEAAIVLAAVNQLSPSGVAAIIVPNGFLSKGGIYQRIRETLVHGGYLRAVVSLPARLFAPSTVIETSILFLQGNNGATQQQDVLFVDARKGGTRKGSKVILDSHIAGRISETLSNACSELGFSQTINRDELEMEDFSLMPAHYVKPEEAGKENSHERRARIEELDKRHALLAEEYEEVRAQLMRI